MGLVATSYQGWWTNTFIIKKRYYNHVATRSHSKLSQKRLQIRWISLLQVFASQNGCLSSLFARRISCGLSNSTILWWISEILDRLSMDSSFHFNKLLHKTYRNAQLHHWLSCDNQNGLSIRADLSYFQIYWNCCKPCEYRSSCNRAVFKSWRWSLDGLQRYILPRKCKGHSLSMFPCVLTLHILFFLAKDTDGRTTSGLKWASDNGDDELS